MEKLMLKKELVELNLDLVFLTKNVRHRHMWHLKSYDPNDLSNYNEEDIIKMAISIIDNISSKKNPFDQEPVVFNYENLNEFKVQTGSTRVIVLKNLVKIVGNHTSCFTDVFTADEIDRALGNSQHANFCVIDRELTESEKRRENNVRSDQHWLSTCIGYHSSILNGTPVKRIAAQEGVSVKNVMELSKLSTLSSKAKKLCYDNVIGKKVAVVLSKLDKTDRKLVVDHILEKGYEKIENPSKLMSVLESSYTVLEDNFPLHAFSTDKKDFPSAWVEPWYLEVKNGMFVKHLSKDIKASNYRKDVYWNYTNSKILKDYPEAKVLTKPKKGMIVTNSRECIDAKHYIINGKLVYGCNSDICEVHGFKIEDNEDDLEREKISKNYEKRVITDTFALIDENFEFLNVNTLYLISLQVLYQKLNKNDKKLAIEIIKPIVNDEIDSESFDFNNYIGNEQISSEISSSFVKLSQSFSLLWLKSNTYMKNHVDAYFSEFNYNLEDLVDEQKLSNMIEDKSKFNDSKLQKKIVSQTKKRNKILDFLVHYVGIETNFPKSNFLKADVVFNEDKTVELSIWPNFDAMFVGSKLNLTSSDTAYSKNELVDLIKNRINEYAPFCNGYYNDEVEVEAANIEYKWHSINKIKDTLYDHFVESSDLFFKGKSGFDILSEACEMINISMATALNNKKIKPANIGESRNEINARVADVGFARQQLDEIISWYIPDAKIHKFFK